MHKQRKLFKLSGLALMGLSLGFGPFAFAAKPIDLSHEKISTLNTFVTGNASLAAKNVTLRETSRQVDFKNQTHVRVQQFYLGYPVFGADAVLHTKSIANQSLQSLVAAKNANTTMNGVIYADIAADLGNGSVATLDAKKDTMIANAIRLYQQKVGTKELVSNKQSKLIVYIDDNNKAHWAYQITFDVKAPENNLPAKPVYILDAQTAQVYLMWDDVKTMQQETSFGGGFGGNLKMGKLIYDGLSADLPQLNILRDTKTNTCTLENPDVIVRNYRDDKVMSYACAAVDPEHNNVYWWGDNDNVNGGYSPSDDAFFGGAVIKDMYSKWYKVPVLVTSDGKPMRLTMVVHAKMDNAYWSNNRMTFGDGISMFYPLTSLGVAAHEISHGFTEQHSGLIYTKQSGGMNEAYSDIAAQAAEFYAYGKSSWQIGPEIFKQEGRALRYLDQPSKDCRGGTPGNGCSIDNADQYYNGLDVHYSSGVYNHFFYILGTTPGWDAKKAFDIMIKANMNYWTSNATYTSGACGVISAAKDYGYNLADVKAAFNAVAIKTSQC